MVRTPGYDKAGLKKGTWTPEEDRKLSAYVTKYGCWNWRQLPKYAGLARCGKSCRLRWMNYLRPNIKRGNYTKEEEDTIIRLHDKLGNRWSAIAAQLPGRTDNEIKNHWHTYLKKQKCMPTTTETKPSDTTSNSVNDDLSQSCTESWNSSQVECEGEAVSHKINEISSSPAASYFPTEMVQDFSETLDTFWSEPFLSEASMTVNEEFSGAVMYPAAGLLSPPHSTYFFDEELFYQYDNLFNSF